MRSILVHADETPAGENRLQAGLDIARRFGAHLTAHINTPIGRLFAMDGFGGVYPLTELIAKAEVDAGALVSAMKERLSRDDVPFTIERSEIEPADALSASARLTDLVIMDLDDASKFARPQTSMVGAVALAGNAPVLALVRGKPVTIDGTVMIAWNDSREAAAAVKAAVPLLALAKSVRVVRIGRNESDMKAESVLEYLSRHGIHAELKIADEGWLTIEEALESEGRGVEGRLDRHGCLWPQPRPRNPVRRRHPLSARKRPVSAVHSALAAGTPPHAPISRTTGILVLLSL